MTTISIVEPLKIFVAAADPKRTQAVEGDLIMGLNDRQLISTRDWLPLELLKVTKYFDGRDTLKRRIMDSLSQVGMATMLGEEGIGDLAEREIEAMISATQRIPYGTIVQRSRRDWLVVYRPTADEQWKAAWPGHCRECLGEGGKHTGGTTANGGVFLHCTVCAGHCPRCGYSYSDDDPLDATGNVPCTRCGWDWGNHATDMAPSR